MHEPLNFKNNKYLLYECRQKHIESNKYYYLLLATDAFLWFFFLRSIYKRRIIRTILWGIPTILLTRTTSGYKVHADHLIKLIELKESGTQIEVTNLSGKKRTFNINQIRKSDTDDLMGAVEVYGTFGLDLYPIHMGDVI